MKVYVMLVKRTLTLEYLQVFKSKKTMFKYAKKHIERLGANWDKDVAKRLISKNGVHIKQPNEIWTMIAYKKNIM